MPSAVKGEIWPKRLPRPGPLGSKVSKLWKSIIRPSSGRAPTRKTTRASKQWANGQRSLQRKPDDQNRRQPDQAGEAVGVDGADRDQGGGDEAQREIAPGAGALAEGQDEGEDEEGLDHLLEGALGVVGGDKVGEADHQGCGGATPSWLVGEGRQGREGGEDRCGDREAVEALDDAYSQALVQSDDHRVRAERVALAQELRAVAVGEAVGRQQVLGHVRVEAGAEDAEVAFDRKGQRGGEQRDDRDREAGAQRLSPALEPCPAGRSRPRSSAAGSGPPETTPLSPASARSPRRSRRRVPGRPPAISTTSASRRRARSPPGQGQARRRKWRARLHTSRSQGGEPRSLERLEHAAAELRRRLARAIVAPPGW